MPSVAGRFYLVRGRGAVAIVEGIFPFHLRCYTILILKNTLFFSWEPDDMQFPEVAYYHCTATPFWEQFWKGRIQKFLFWIVINNYTAKTVRDNN